VSHPQHQGILGGTQLLIDAVWRGADVRDPGEAALEHALRLAYGNDVQGRLARALPERLERVCRETEATSDAFRRNLKTATELLWAHGVRPVLIKADPSADCVYPNFDLVVTSGQWPVALHTLQGWAKRRERYWLERSTKELFWPSTGPGAHLHTAVTWFGVDVIAAEGLLQRSSARRGDSWLIPSRADQLRIWLAHALFQNLAFSLSELLALRSLLEDGLVAVARRQADEEGWLRAFDSALDLTRAAMGRLDLGEAVPLPFPLPGQLSMTVALEHAWNTGRAGRLGPSVREIALRGPLILAKRLSRRAEP
jgi:hypothetical protein